MSAILKICLLGEWGVGKTTLVRSYLGGETTETYKATIGVDIGSKDLKVNYGGRIHHVVLQLWDLGGQQSLKNIRKNFYASAVGGIVVYDITRPETLKKVPMWLDELWNAVGIVPIVLVGNKIDLREKGLGKITTDEGQRVANEIKAKIQMPVPFVEASALRHENSDKPFEELATLILEKRANKIA